jgi:hypothetical protein
MKEAAVGMSPHYLVATESSSAFYPQYSVSGGVTHRVQHKEVAAVTAASGGQPSQQQPDVPYSAVMTSFSSPTVCHIVNSNPSHSTAQNQYQFSNLDGHTFSQQQLSQLSGQQLSQLSGQQLSQLSGQQLSQLSGQQLSQLSGQQLSQLSGQQLMQLSGQQRSQSAGQQLSGQQLSHLSGQQLSHISGQQLSQLSGQQLLGQQGSQLSGQQLSQLTGQQQFISQLSVNQHGTQQQISAQNLQHQLNAGQGLKARKFGFHFYLCYGSRQF